MSQRKFYNISRGELSLEEVIQEIVSYVSREAKGEYDVVVGCDSSSGETPVFPVVIVVRHLGKGGRFFVHKVRFAPEKKRFFDLHSRILQEVYLSCQVALELKENLTQALEEAQLQPRCHFRYIHADIGGDKETKIMIKEVVNLIKGNGFEAKIKPESYAASAIADRFTK
jgi:uncharacterized protein